MFHGQWLEPGSHTIQEEAAHPSSLYLIMDCDNIHIGAIVSKCNIQPFHCASSLPIFNIHQPNDFFTRYSKYSHCELWIDQSILSFVWDKDHCRFINPTEQALEDALRAATSPMPCYSCGASELESLAQIPTLLQLTPSSPCLKYLGHTFHPLDFVYLIPKGNSHLYDIGQILSIPNSEEIQVLKYRRLDQPQGPFSEVHVTLIESANILLNELKIVLVPTAKVLTLPSERLEGICWAKSYHSMPEDEYVAWCSLPDHYVVHGADLKHGLGFQLHNDYLSGEERFFQLHEPLRGLELFSGMFIFPKLPRRMLM